MRKSDDDNAKADVKARKANRAVRVAQTEPPPGDGVTAPPAPGPATSPDHPASPDSTVPANSDIPPSPAPAANVAGTPDLNDADLAKLAEEAASSGGETIVVTGSAIGRAETTTASPVSVVDREALDDAGITNVGDILQKLPAQGNALNAQNNNGGDGSTRIDLRSLGQQRTLTLMNGRRIISSGLGADSGVDIGTIPLAIIDRVEVLKDGASAVYGSDAISGVVNIITKQDFQGTEASVYTATSQRGDGTNYNLSFVTGHSSKKGNVMFSASFQKQDAIKAGDRGFSKNFADYDYSDPGPNGKLGFPILAGSSSTPNGRLNTAEIDGVNNSMPLNVPGCTTQFCTANGTGGFRNFIGATSTSFNDAYNFQPANYLVTPSQRIDLFSSGHYDLTPNIRAFFEASYDNRQSGQQLASEPLVLGQFGLDIDAASIYNPLGQEVADYNRRLVEFGDRATSQEINTFRGVVGINGKIPDDAPAFKNWKWEVSFDAGRSSSTQQSSGDLIVSHLANALGPSFVDATGTPQCGTPGNIVGSGCVPLNLLNPGHVTQAMINYLTFIGVQSGFNDERVTSAQASGQVVKLPNGGDLSVAIGGDYRHEQGGFTPDPLTSTGDTTGNAQEPTEGSYSAWEGFGEVSLVPVSGKKFAQWVELDAAGRIFDYNNFGEGTTYKVSGLWKTAGGLSLRGTYGTAFRAPAVSELFAGHADSFPEVNDPCDAMPPSATGPVTLSPVTQKECNREGVPTGHVFGSNQQRITVGGNTQLQPETAKIGTAGIVWEPIKGFDVTLDYWNIEIDKTITSVPITTLFGNCYSLGNAATCGLITRDPVTHIITHVLDLNQNLGNLITSGMDFSASYQYDTGIGKWRHSLDGTYLFKYNEDTGAQVQNPNNPNGPLVEQVLHGRGNYDIGALPDLKFNILTSWIHPSGFGAGFNFRFIDSFHECQNNDCNNESFDDAAFVHQVGKYFNADVFADYSFKTIAGTTRIAVGINNVADVTPETVYNNLALNSDPSLYDFVGRYFYIRLSQLF